MASARPVAFIRLPKYSGRWCSPNSVRNKAGDLKPQIDDGDVDHVLKCTGICVGRKYRGINNKHCVHVILIIFLVDEMSWYDPQVVTAKFIPKILWANEFLKAQWVRSFLKRRTFDSKLYRFWWSWCFVPPFVIQRLEQATPCACGGLCKEMVRASRMVTFWVGDGRIWKKKLLETKHMYQ